MSEHRHSGRHTEPSEENEINLMEETTYRRARVPRGPAEEAVAQSAPAHSDNDEIPRTHGDQARKSERHYHREKSSHSAASEPLLPLSREKPVTPSKAHTWTSTLKQSGDSSSSFGSPYGAVDASTRDDDIPFENTRGGKTRSISLPTSALYHPSRKEAVKTREQPVPIPGSKSIIVESKQEPSGASASNKDEDVRVQVLSLFFHLECTNFVAKSISGILSSKKLGEAIKETLSKTDIDLLEFVAVHSVYECSHHQGNRFISLNVRVFEPPPRESGQLLDSDITIAEEIEGGLLVEVQLREGDRLHFSSLFRELLTNFSEVEGVKPTGTLRYKPQPSPLKGEGLVLEKIKLSRSPSFRTNALLESVPRKGDDSTIEPLDEEMIEDVFKLVEVLESDFLDTQADAATAVAGLTSDDEFREQLSDPKARKAAEALCKASARLLVETKYRPARRQAAVIVANLSSYQALGGFVLDSDPPLKSGKPGIVDSLVTLAMQRSKEEKEEEIGTRRECMRALTGLAKFKRASEMRAMMSLRSTTPSGKGGKCKKLKAKLMECRNVLSNQPPWP